MCHPSSTHFAWINARQSLRTLPVRTRLRRYWAPDNIVDDKVDPMFVSLPLHVDGYQLSTVLPAALPRVNGLKPYLRNPTDGPTPAGWGVAEAAWLAAGSNGQVESQPPDQGDSLHLRRVR